MPDTPQSFAVGSAPWETSAPGPEHPTFAVGEAPWEKSSPLDKVKEEGKRLLRGAAENLPAIGSILGGMTGAVGGTILMPGPGSVEGGIIGAGVGAAGGAALKQIIEQKFAPSEIPNEAAKAMAGQAAAGPLIGVAKAAAPAVGEAMTGVPAPIIKAYLNGEMGVQSLLSQAGGSIATAAKAVQGRIANAIGVAQSDMEAPALNIIAKRASTQSDAEVGSSVKNLILSDIKQKYSPFIDAYDKIDQVHQSLPLSEDGRLKLTSGIKDWALENHPESSDTYKLLQKHANNLDASNTGAQLRGASSDIAGDLSDAYKTGNSKRIEALNELQNRVSDFQEKEMRGLASRVSKGTATPQEAEAFHQMAAQQGIDPGENSARYAKQITNDYMSSVDKINSDYGGFKDYLGALQQQTGARKSMGAGTLIKNITAIPDEKLVSKMFTTDNAAALTRLKTEQPQVFSQLAGAHIRDLVKDATTAEGTDVGKFINSVNEMPKEIRNLTFSPTEQASLKSVADNPQLKRLNELQDSYPKDMQSVLKVGRGGDTDATRDLIELSGLTKQNLVGDTNKLAAAADIVKASPKSILKRSGTGAAAAAGALNVAGVHDVPKSAIAGTVGALGGAATSPYALKIGLGALNSPATPAILSQGVIRGAQGVQNMLQNNLTPPGGGQ